MGNKRPDAQAYRQARRTAEAKLGFYIHFSVYVLVNALLLGINLLASPEVLWFFWAAIGWGIGILFHGLAVFLFGESSSMKKRLIEKELARQK